MTSLHTSTTPLVVVGGSNRTNPSIHPSTSHNNQFQHTTISNRTLESREPNNANMLCFSLGHPVMIVNNHTQSSESTDVYFKSKNTHRNSHALKGGGQVGKKKRRTKTKTKNKNKGRKIKKKR